MAARLALVSPNHIKHSEERERQRYLRFVDQKNAEIIRSRDRELARIDRMNAEIDRSRDEELAQIDRMNAEYSARNRRR